MMKIKKQFVSLFLATAIAATFFAGNASARQNFYDQAPNGSIEICIAEIGAQANYVGAGRVLHRVATKKRRISGHTITIDTTVYAVGSTEVVREYASRCVVTGSQQTKQFEMHEKHD